MNTTELAEIVREAVQDNVGKESAFIKANKDLHNAYMGEMGGIIPDADEGQSNVVSTDVADVVEADMPSLARVFLGAGDVVEFEATTEAQIQEVEEKNLYVPWVIENCANSFLEQHDFLKQVETQKVGILEYGIEERTTVEYRRFEGMDDLEIEAQKGEFESDDAVDDVIVLEEEDGVLAVNLIRKRKDFYIRTVPTDDLIMTRNARTKDDAQIIGKHFRTTRSDLIARGFDEDKVRALPKAANSSESTQQQERVKDQGGKDDDPGLHHWANEQVEGVDVYVEVDFDEDGYTELRHIIQFDAAGEGESTILLNEPAGHKPFALGSAIKMPHVLIGRARAELPYETQKIQSVLYRQVMNNIYGVNHPRTVVSHHLNLSDMMTIRPNGVVRTNSKTDQPPANLYSRLEIPYVGDKALQVIQYVDSKRAQTTGSLMANQGLQADQLHKETATRFRGVQEEGSAKIELVARVIAESCYKELYKGIAWFARTYKKAEQEIYVMGRTMMVNPGNWKHEDKVSTAVGLGTEEKNLQDLIALFGVQSELQQQGSVLVDDKKRYNTLKKMTRIMGITGVDQHFNDPERPLMLVMAENEILRNQNAMLVQASDQPLAEAERVRGEAKLVEKQMDNEQELRVKAMEQETKRRQMQTDAAFKDREMNLKEREAAVEARYKEAKRIEALVNAQAQDIENDAVASGITELLNGQTSGA